MEENEEQDVTPDEEVSDEEAPKLQKKPEEPLDRAERLNKEKQALLDREQKLIERKEKLFAEALVGGRSEAGGKVEKKEESPQEYSQRLMRGELTTDELFK